MRRFTHTKALHFSAVNATSIRSIANRRMLLPIGMQLAKEEQLTNAKLLVKWTSVTKRYFHLVPVILAVTEATSEPAAEVTSSAGVQAGQTFRRITLNAHDLASILCVMEKKQSQASFINKGMSIKFEMSGENIVMKGAAIPHEGREEIDESKKKLFVGSLDAANRILFKSHLESILTEMLGIEHYHNVTKNIEYNQRSHEGNNSANNYQQRRSYHDNGHHNNNNNNNGGRYYNRNQRSTQRSPPRVAPQQLTSTATSSPPDATPSPVIRAAIPGQFASELKDDVIIANHVLRDMAQASTTDAKLDELVKEVVPAEGLPSATELTRSDNVVIPVEDEPSSTTSSQAPAKKKSSSKSTKKAKSRAEKKKADAAAQELFEMS